MAWQVVTEKYQIAFLNMHRPVSCRNYPGAPSPPHPYPQYDFGAHQPLHRDDGTRPEIPTLKISREQFGTERANIFSSRRQQIIRIQKAKSTHPGIGISRKNRTYRAPAENILRMASRKQHRWPGFAINPWVNSSR
jgi:hypothetical protein